jgi:hypothetical protein
MPLSARKLKRAAGRHTAGGRDHAQKISHPDQSEGKFA